MMSVSHPTFEVRELYFFKKEGKMDMKNSNNQRKNFQKRDGAAFIGKKVCKIYNI